MKWRIKNGKNRIEGVRSEVREKNKERKIIKQIQKEIKQKRRNILNRKRR